MAASNRLYLVSTAAGVLGNARIVNGREDAAPRCEVAGVNADVRTSGLVSCDATQAMPIIERQRFSMV